MKGETFICYGVEIQRADGFGFLAYSQDNKTNTTHRIPATFKNRSQAVAHKRELKIHKLKGKVVKLEVTVRIIP